MFADLQVATNLCWRPRGSPVSGESDGGWMVVGRNAVGPPKDEGIKSWPLGSTQRFIN